MKWAVLSVRLSLGIGIREEEKPSERQNGDSIQSRATKPSGILAGVEERRTLTD